MRILLVEDSKSLTEALETVLKKERHTVDIAYNGEDGVYYASSCEYDIIIMDVMMPVMDGFEALRRIRKKGISVPVIMLTALSQEADKVKGLDYGADDYLTKPFSIPELLARIRALTRRKGELIPDEGLSYGGVYLNQLSYMLSYNGKEVKLSKKEYDLLNYFFRNPGFVAERESIISKVWGFESEFESNNLDVFMSFIRKKLKFIGAPFTIISMRGVGYRLSDVQK